MRALIACGLALWAWPSLADDIAIAILSERSGSVAPAYAWSWDVTFGAEGRVNTRYCKGYADTAPGCASREDLLTAERFDALTALLATLSPAPEDPAPPIGGGARWAVTGAVTLPAHPLPGDAARVTAALDALAAFIPEGALDDTASRAKAP